MKKHTLLLIVGLTLAGLTSSFAASPSMGTWKLNEKKSKLGTGGGKNSTVVYKSNLFGQVTVTVDGTDASGKPAHNEWTGKFDGKDYAVKGDPNFDMRAYKQVNDNTLDMTLKRGGKMVGMGRIVISADGKMRTVTTNATTAKGKKVHSVAVYDKA